MNKGEHEDGVDIFYKGLGSGQPIVFSAWLAPVLGTWDSAD